MNGTKRILALAIAVVLCVSFLSACSDSKAPPTPVAPVWQGGTSSAPAPSNTPASVPASSGGVINLWSFTDEVPLMVEKYKELNPGFNYEINTTIISTTDGEYQPALDEALAAGGEDAPDLFQTVRRG